MSIASAGKTLRNWVDRATPVRAAILILLGMLSSNWDSTQSHVAVADEPAAEEPPAKKETPADAPPSNAASQAETEDFAKLRLPLFTRYCGKCHGEQEPQGEFQLSRLGPSMTDEEDYARWNKVLEKLHSGAMPPMNEPRPSDEEIGQLIGWIQESLRAAEMADRVLHGRVVLRRLNRAQYENTICDLLRIKTDLQGMLALDGSADGFDNVSSALHLSTFALERYLEAGDKALNLAIANNTRPPLIQGHYDLRKERSVTLSQESVFRLTDDAVVMLSSSEWNGIWLYDFYPPDGGLYRIRISAQAMNSEGKPVSYRVANGDLRGKHGLIGYFDAPPDKPQVAEVYAQIEPRSTISILPYGLATAHVVVKSGAEKYEGPGLAIQWVEVEGPLHESWPPPSHSDLFENLKQEPFPDPRIGQRLEVVSSNPEHDARQILQRFLRLAFRRNIQPEEVEPYLSLFRDQLAQGHRFEQAIRVPLLAALVSDEFLFLREEPGALNDFSLASRLSYFLWNSLPDESLLQRAAEGKLRDPAVLRQEVERMLQDPKVTAFTESFVGQWLGLRNIDFTEPNHVYPEFDHMLKVSMIRETELFFTEVLNNNLSLTNFVDSDFSMLNGRLARHYGIPGPSGWEFEKVSLPPGCHRGGVLTMASVLKVTANGSYTHPVHRGVWVLERILGQRPPNPPANVPVVEPDTRGAKGIKEQLALHSQASCASCHSKIDPPGFALESFDVIGQWRENYRTTGLGEAVTINGVNMPYLKGPSVECSGTLPDGRKFENIDDYKRLLLEDKDQLARAMTMKLVTYATGAAPERLDQDEVERIVAKIREESYGMKSLIHAIVESPLFLNK